MSTERDRPVLTNRNGDIVVITLNRPEAMNSFNGGHAERRRLEVSD
jgi:enoyl-CoA hydratase/carnithine racemase